MRTKPVARRKDPAESQRRTRAQRPRKPHVFKLQQVKPGTPVLRTIRRFQNPGMNDVLLRRRPFQRLVMELSSDFISGGHRFERSAIDALKQATEAHMVSLLSDAHLCSLHGRRQTLMVKDLLLARRLRGEEALLAPQGRTQLGLRPASLCETPVRAPRAAPVTPVRATLQASPETAEKLTPPHKLEAKPTPKAIDFGAASTAAAAP